MPIALLLQLASIVPGLLKFAGAGDTAEKVATQAVEIAKTVTGLSDPAQAVTHIISTPAAQNDFILASNKQMLEWEQMYVTDIANARARDVAISSGGKINWSRFFLTGFASIGIFILLSLVLTDKVTDDFVKSAIMLILGRLLGYLDGIFNFEFGTTRTSQSKDATITKLAGTGS